MEQNEERLEPGRLQRLQRLSNLMDAAFTVPGTGIRFGIDPILGLIPGIGDTLSACLSIYIYSHARKACVPRRARLRMLWNIFLDWFVGLFPFLGDLFDIGFRVNTRNVAIISDYTEREAGEDVSA